MSVARRAGSGAASASVQYATRRRWAAAAATRRRWAVAARASRSCWAAEATRSRWAVAARANRNNAISSGPIITRDTKRWIATTKTPAIPIATNISYKNISSPPPLAVGTDQRDGRASSSQIGPLLSRTLNTLTLCRGPDTRENFWARVRQGSRLEDRFVGSSGHWLNRRHQSDFMSTRPSHRLA